VDGACAEQRGGERASEQRVARHLRARPRRVPLDRQVTSRPLPVRVAETRVASDVLDHVHSDLLARSHGPGGDGIGVGLHVVSFDLECSDPAGFDTSTH